jgi:hypothetical protein
MADGNIPDNTIDQSLAEFALTNQQASNAEATSLAPVGHVPCVMPARTGHAFEPVTRVTALKEVPECIPDILGNVPPETLPIN